MQLLNLRGSPHMGKRKRWQSVLIVLVLILTAYNILPTVCYYSRSLNKPIDEKEATNIALHAIQRVNNLEVNAIAWVDSFARLLDIKDSTSSIDRKNPQFITVNFAQEADLDKFKHFLPTAGALIPFAPEQLSLIDHENTAKQITIQRNIPIHFDHKNVDTFFVFSQKKDSQNQITELYRDIVFDRLLQTGLAVGGISENANYLSTILHHNSSGRVEEFIFLLAQNILSYVNAFGEDSPITNRYFTTFSQETLKNKRGEIESLVSSINKLKDSVKLERIQLQEKETKKRSAGGFLEANEQQELHFLLTREETLSSAASLINRNITAFSEGGTPWRRASLQEKIHKSYFQMDPLSHIQTLDVGSLNPLISMIRVDWRNETIHLDLHDDVLSYQNTLDQSKSPSYKKDRLDQFIYNEIARIGRESGENISPFQKNFQIVLNDLTNSKTLLVMKLHTLAEQKGAQLLQLIRSQWNPNHPDLKRESFPIWDQITYESLPANEKGLGLVVYTPATLDEEPIQGLKTNSIYVIVKGVDDILKKFSQSPNSPQSKIFFTDFDRLRTLLKNNGFIGYPGTSYPLSNIFAKDYIFEAEDYYQMIIKGTREQFQVHGTKKYATLEFTNVEQRILTLNKIETEIHEDLLKWEDDYQAAQISPNNYKKFDVPKPTKSALWSNLALSSRKYFRGDERKVLHWGLDLSGGKTVQIELRNMHNRVVTNDSDINKGINELYNRVNKMGVSEVSIRQEGSNITLDFPSAQSLSANDLIKASSMYFHIVNEKFTPANPTLNEPVNQFLQGVWNEAIVTNKKDIENINRIAWKHLYGKVEESEIAQPMSEAGKILYDHGLRLSSPNDLLMTSQFNDSISKLTLLRGENFSDWHNQTHPLLIVMNNYAIEGSNLENVHASYDPSKGNFLGFTVKSSQIKHGQKITPRNDLYNWTAPFSKENIMGTPREKDSPGRGWRMAVILNDSVISAPTLESPLRDNVMISGQFSQREVNKLESDLKAGSLSFTPHILSEKNVTPELGIKDRYKGIFATILALILVIVVMIGYYRFAGIIASIAVLFNLLLMWATLQNIQATMTLAGIAAIVLTLGMAVDANVLVFERIREEYSASGKIGTAIRIGYQKALSAIIDSNMTTIIAALILLHFDSGPIKGFAITLIIGIISSMFTALFMTRYFFAGWVQKKKNVTLKMSSFFHSTKIQFLKYSKTSFIITLAIIFIGGFVLTIQKDTIMGMDFTGGYALTLEVKPKQDTNYRLDVTKSLESYGLTKQDFQVRTLTLPNHIKLLLSRSMDLLGNPFANMPLQIDEKNTQYEYQLNPRIVWVVNALQASGIELTEQSLTQLENQWTNISGQVSDAMRNNALLGLMIALICILIYITIRFEFKYAISATLGLAIDVAFTVSAIAILHAMSVPIQIDLNTIVALMTIIGYSLNDTIIILDRIREDLKTMRKNSFKEIVEHALNITLGRTIMTSGTTLIVLLALLSLGGASIFGLALVMIIGVVFGTFSSLFIAAPMLYFFHNRERPKKNKPALKNISS